MIYDDLITFLPEVLLLAFGLLAIGLATFHVNYFKSLLPYIFQGLLVLNVIMITEFSSPYEIMAFSDFLVSNHFTNFFKILILLSLFLIQVAIQPHLQKEDLNKPEFFALTAFACAGYMLMISSQNFISLFMATELASFSTYLMVTFQRQSLVSTEAGLKYFALGSLATAVFLWGVSFVYGSAGTLSFSPLALTEPSFYIPIGLVFIITAFAFKLSLVPFHMWTPDVYQGSVTPVTFFLAIIPKLAAFAVLVRLSMVVFHQTDYIWQPVFTGLCVVSIIVGSFTALFQKSIKRLIAYSTISHMGYSLLGLLVGSFDGITSLLVYLSIYTLTTAGIFSCLLCLRCRGKIIEELEDFRYLGTQSPFIAGTLVVLLFSLAGLPPLAGFFAKLNVFSAALAGGYTALVILSVLSSVVAAGFYLKIIKTMYFEEETLEKSRFTGLDIRQPKSTLIVIMISLLFVVSYSFLFQFVNAYAYKATKSVFIKR